MMSAAVAGPTFRPIASYTTLRDVTERSSSVHLHPGLLELSVLGSCSASSEARMSSLTKATRNYS